MSDDGDLRQARRILLYGVTGSGKSTLAARIGGLTGVPWYSVDDLTWEPGWVPVPDDEQRRRIAAICRQDEWILDSGYSRWIDLPLARVEVIVALDYPRLLSLARLVGRTATRILDRRQICNGNRETLSQVFTRESILRWHFRSFTRKRRRMRQWAADPVGPVVQRFRSPRDVERVVPELRKQLPAPPSTPPL